MQNLRRLNPFEFRAGLKPGLLVRYTSDCGLNPFEFRAGLKRRNAGTWDSTAS